MITPNLATRPFLNTRPVWVLSGVAAVLTLIFVVLNLRLFLVANRALDDEIAQRDSLEQRHRVVEAEVRSDIEALKKVPWRSLATRVDATNAILREHAFSWLQMLNDIENVMPYDVRLTKIGPSVGPDGVVLSIEVIARNRDAMLQILDNLLEDPRFEDPTPSSEATPEESGGGSYLMNLRVTYHPPEEGS